MTEAKHPDFGLKLRREARRPPKDGRPAQWLALHLERWHQQDPKRNGGEAEHDPGPNVAANRQTMAGAAGCGLSG